MVVIQKSNNKLILAIIITCQLMVVLDASIMITALPEIGRGLHLATTSLTWVQNAYVLAFGGFLLLGARAGDLVGRRRVFIIGTAIFTVASLLAGFAQSAEMLFATRALQGIGAALATPSALALLSVSFVETKERVKAIAMYSAVNGAGGSIGLVVGGMLTDWISWRVGMFINVPIGILLLVMAPRFLPETNKSTGRFDIMGAITSVVGLTALVYGFVRAADDGWGNSVTIISLLTGVVLLAAFAFIESRVEQPITPLRLFSSRERSGAYLGRLLFVGGLFSMFFFLSQFLQHVLGFTALETGLAFLPMTMVQFGMMYAMPWLVARYGNAKVLVSGIFVVIIGMSFISQISTDLKFFPGILIPMVILGIGAGTVFIPFTTFGLSGVDPRDAGAASGLVNVSHQTGGSLGLAVLTAVFGSFIPTGTTPTDSQFTTAVSTSIIGSIVFITVSFIVVLLLLVRPGSNKAAKDEGRDVKGSTKVPVTSSNVVD
ncbi:MFS transporter [Cohnella abietis]|uniref:MFS transporter n=1 Tax=Cohnella abietis TaxID=2507935 RepID=UPI00102E3101|nr:MFS transporter [Cohnella abietis]